MAIGVHGRVNRDGDGRPTLHITVVLPSVHLHSWSSTWKVSLIPDRGLERPGPEQIQKGPHASTVCSVDVVGVLVVVHVPACI